MVGTATIAIQAIKFGYDRYGPKGAVAAAAAIGSSYLLVKRIVPRYTDLNEEKVGEMYEQMSNDGDVVDILGDEFASRFGAVRDDGGSQG